ncbi:thiol peroxidase (atypical 2-Cys peroxiredoxin) [Alkalispirochaeta americana]|uniref:Thiol peroxidase n=1 Tax=Alkalispirochaeta americana TaxID=159291 RepID=A0A1N6NZR4_9SPIO|nr:thiol peroxidase [Alkalispirochaeta americana]SIP97594.1 thiol peroxidase (atypical 2-Cys peroxiredoxin) [Alkalispirochaeta americana]
MATITFKGNPTTTSGVLPAPGTEAPDFCLTDETLQDKTLGDFAGRKKILNIVPSLDTGVCAASARKFDKEMAKRPQAVCLTISRDLPFAATRFCKTEGVSNVITLSDLRDHSFGRDYGCEILDGPFAGLLSRALVVLDEENRVIYCEQVPEIAQEPDYRKALQALG